MNPQSSPSRKNPIRWLLAVLAASFAVPAFAQSAGKTAVPQKMVSVAFANAPWADVLEWFAKESGLAMIATATPTGTVTIKADPKKKFTIAEVVDLLNRSLALQKFILLRIDSTTFTVLPADEKIPREYVGRIPESELVNRGNSEFVQVVIELKSFNADEALEQVRSRLGRFGDVKAIGGNRLLFTDTAGTVRAVIADLKHHCESVGESLTYRCKTIAASEAAKSLAKLLAWPVPVLPEVDARTKPVQIAVQAKTNSVLVTGPADRVASAFEILQYLDGVRSGKTEPVLRIYSVPAKSAEALAKLLNERYGDPKFIRIAAVPGRDEIMVLAPMWVHFDLILKTGQSMEVVQPPPCVAVPCQCPMRERLFSRLTCWKLRR